MTQAQQAVGSPGAAGVAAALSTAPSWVRGKTAATRARTALRILAVALVLAVPSTALAASTARQALKEVTAAAQKWQPDAVLTHLSTLRARADGKADEWLYTFYSPKAKKSAIVTARDAKVQIDADVRNTSTHPLGAEFLDSDKAAEAALNAGLKFDQGAKNLGFGLAVGNQATGKPNLFWSVTVMGDKGFSAVTLGGRDGALVKRDDVKF